MKINSPEYSQMQRDRIMKSKPWLKTKGAATPEGRNISKMNALKTPIKLHILLMEAKQLFKQQRDLTKAMAL